LCVFFRSRCVIRATFHAVVLKCRVYFCWQCTLSKPYVCECVCVCVVCV
jgi:hypothetical protein